MCRGKCRGKSGLDCACEHGHRLTVVHANAVAVTTPVHEPSLAQDGCAEGLFGPVEAMEAMLCPWCDAGRCQVELRIRQSALGRDSLLPLYMEVGPF